MNVKLIYVYYLISLTVLGIAFMVALLTYMLACSSYKTLSGWSSAVRSDNNNLTFLEGKFLYFKREETHIKLKLSSDGVLYEVEISPDKDREQIFESLKEGEDVVVIGKFISSGRYLRSSDGNALVYAGTLYSLKNELDRRMRYTEIVKFFSLGIMIVLFIFLIRLISWFRNIKRMIREHVMQALSEVVGVDRERLESLHKRMMN